MLRNTTIAPGYNIVVGQSSDGMERALGDLQSKVRVIQEEYDMESLNFTLKYDEAKRNLVFAIHVMNLTPKAKEAEPVADAPAKPKAKAAPKAKAKA